jgi:pimeloyl-ACP methyl ester carboxylesterase
MKYALRICTILFVVAVIGGLVFYFDPLWVADQDLRFRLWHKGVKSEYVEAGGYRLHYFEASPKDGSAGTPLLLVHGLGARGEDWAGMIPEMVAKGFHVYVPDLPGYGRSSRPSDANYSISMEEAAVVAFMQAMHLTHADVGGWSMGGWISLKLTLDHPELVDRLVVYDSAGVYFPATWQPDLFVPTDSTGVQRLMEKLSPIRRVMPEFAARAVVRKIQGNAWVVNRSMAAMVNGRDLLDFRLHNIQRPTLIVWGSQDDLIPLAAGKRMHELIPGSVLDEVEGCGHLAPAECVKPVVEGTVDFLRAEPPMQAGERVLSAAR